MENIVDRVVDLTQLTKLATLVARRAIVGDVVALYGDLGTGKTTFVRAALRGLGWTAEVPSPTFTLAQLYEIKGLRLWHFDLYRLDDSREAIELGIDEAFADGVSFVEWPERLVDSLPTTRLDVALNFAEAPDLRRVAVRGDSSWASRLADLGHPS